MTGGEAQIQDIQPYYGVEFHSLIDTEGLEEGGADEDRILELKELARVDVSRSAKTVSVQPKKSVHRIQGDTSGCSQTLSSGPM